MDKNSSKTHNTTLDGFSSTNGILGNATKDYICTSGQAACHYYITTMVQFYKKVGFIEFFLGL